jgi:2-deoxy-D-gluconate 3-dehydrogenase
MSFDDMFSIKGKTALVTGGSKGIGEMIASGFVARGAKVYIVARNAENCAATASRISEEYGGECIAIQGDIVDMAGIEAIAAKIGQCEDKLHILVNNAGASRSAPFDEFSEDDWDIPMDMNAKSPFFMIQKLAPLLRNAASHEDPARVVNISSIGGLRMPRFGNFSYGPSKAAVIHMTRQMGVHLMKDNIILNCIAPGSFPTPMLSGSVGFGGKTEGEGVDWGRIGENNPRGRVGTPENAAGLAIFLCSRAGDYTVGATITCDGGALASS